MNSSVEIPGCHQMAWGKSSKSSSVQLSEIPSKYKLQSCRSIASPFILTLRICLHLKLLLVTQSCWILCDPMDCSPPGSSVHGILQARILEWVAIPFSRGSSRPRDRTLVSPITGRFFTVWTSREAHLKLLALTYCLEFIFQTSTEMCWHYTLFSLFFNWLGQVQIFHN